MSDVKHTPTPWFVRKRENEVAGLVDCFVAAKDVNGFAFDAEILGDDEYREEGGGIARKLADCEFIVRAVNSHAQLIEALEAVANDVHRKRGTISLGTLNIVAEALAQARESTP